MSISMGGGTENSRAVLSAMVQSVSTIRGRRNGGEIVQLAETARNQPTGNPNCPAYHAARRLIDGYLDDVSLPALEGRLSNPSLRPRRALDPAWTHAISEFSWQARTSLHQGRTW